MKNIQLDFVQRFKLIDLLSAQEGPLGKTAPYLRCFEKIRFTDEEARQITPLPMETPKGMMTRFEPPSDQPEFGKKKVQIEDADAEKLKSLIEEWPHFTTQDHAWADPVIRQLAKEKRGLEIAESR